MQIGPRRLDQDVDLLGRARAALGVADDPAHGVAGGDGAGADELLAVLQRDVGDLAGRGIDLIERAGGEGIDLHGVDEAVAHRLHARGGIGLIDAHRSDRSASGGALPSVKRLQLSGQRQGLRQLDDLHRRRRIGGELRRRGVVVGDVRRDELVAQPPSAVAEISKAARPAFTERRNRLLSGSVEMTRRDVKPDRRLPWKSAGSLSQLLRPVDGVDVDAERILAQPSASVGGWIAMVRIAVQRVVSASAPSW